jgi:hypothetical protein
MVFHSWHAHRVVRTNSEYMVSVQDANGAGLTFTYGLAAAAVYRICDLRMRNLKAPWMQEALGSRATIKLLHEREAAPLLGESCIELSQYVYEQRDWPSYFSSNAELTRHLDWGRITAASFGRSAVVVMGAATTMGLLLEEELGWERLCQVVNYGSYSDWVESLPVKEKAWLMQIIEGVGRSF